MPIINNRHAIEKSKQKITNTKLLDNIVHQNVIALTISVVLR